MASPLSERVKADSAYRRYRKILENIRSTFDPNEVETEAKLLHAGRPSRHMNPKTISPRELIEANMKDLSNRGRFVELRISLSEHEVNLSTTLVAVKRHLQSELSEYLSGRTKEERRQRLDGYFRQGDMLLAEIDRLNTMLDLFIKDIDQAGFSMRNLVTLMEMVYKPERPV